MKTRALKTLANQVGVPIRKICSEKLAEIAAAPQAQKRTAIFKKAVYIVDGFAYKGPYACDDPRLMNNLKYITLH